MTNTMIPLKREIQKADTATYEKERIRLAFTFSPRIYPCHKCNHAVAQGYICGYCGDHNPDQDAIKEPEQDERWDGLS